MNKTIAVLLAGVSFLSLTACEEACTLEARTSVLVHVSDAEGEPLDGQVQFDAGDGPQAVSYTHLTLPTICSV